MTALSGSDLAREVAATQAALNLVWLLLTAFLVMFMQAGFALLETGLTRAKNVAHTMGMNFLVYSLGVLVFWAVGFGLQMGGAGPLTTLGGDASLNAEFTISLGGHQWGLFGMRGFFLDPQVFTPAVAAVFLFQMVFMDTALTIPTGALAERWRFGAFVGFSVILAALIYPLFANWVWGGGWLSALGRNLGWGHGHVDFAGSTVVHLTGGVVAFIGAKRLGPRLGKFGPDGSPRAIPGHNVAYAVLGTFILAFGWFGFNAGSTLAGTDTRIAVVAVNTMLASAAGGVAGCAYVWSRFGKPDVSMMCNGMLGGLVAITASCAFVSAAAAVFIGAVAGVLVIAVATFVESVLKVDDPVGAIAVHGGGGAWGTVALGLFANGTYGAGLNGVEGGVRGLLYGDAGQLLANGVGIVVNVVFVGGTSYLAFSVVQKVISHRVAEHDELTGLDLPEMGIEGYTSEPTSEPAAASSSARWAAE